MKLANDFGVRALLATIGGAGFYAVLGYVLVKFELDVTTVIALVAMAQVPWTAAVGFYFGFRSAQVNHG